MRIDNGELGIDNGNFVIMKNLIISPAVEAEPQKSSRFSSFGRVVSSALIVANDDDDEDYDDVFWAKNAVFVFSRQHGVCCTLTDGFRDWDV